MSTTKPPIGIRIYRFLSENPFFIFLVCLLAGSIVAIPIILDLSIKIKVVGVFGVMFIPLLFMVKDIKHLILFIFAAIIPLYLGKDIEDFLTRPGFKGGFTAIGIHVAEVLAVALLLIFIARLATGREVRARPTWIITIPAILWITTGIISWINVRDLTVAIIQVIGMARVFLVYLAVAVSVENKRDLKWLMVGMMVAVMFQSTVAIFQTVFGRPLGLHAFGEPGTADLLSFEDEIFVRAAGTLYHPNALGIYLASALPLILASLLSWQDRNYRAIGLLAFVMGTVALICSLSRGGWIGYAIACSLVILAGLIWSSLSRRLKAAIYISIALGVLILAFAGTDVIKTRFTADDNGSAQSRIIMANGAFNMLRDYKLFGVGINNFTIYVPEYDIANVQIWGAEPEPVHNVYLLVATETGLVGLAAFLWLFASILFLPIKLFIQTNDNNMKVFFVGLFAMYIAIGIHSLVDYQIINNWSIARHFWVFAGVAAGLSQTVLEKQQSYLSNSRYLKRRYLWFQNKSGHYS